MAKTKPLDVWIMVDSQGKYAVGTSETDAFDSYDANYSLHPIAIRLIVNSPLPEPITVTVNIEEPSQETPATTTGRRVIAETQT